MTAVTAFPAVTVMTLPSLAAVVVVVAVTVVNAWSAPLINAVTVFAAATVATLQTVVVPCEIAGTVKCYVDDDDGADSTVLAAVGVAIHQHIDSSSSDFPSRVVGMRPHGAGLAAVPSLGYLDKGEGRWGG